MPNSIEKTIETYISHPRSGSEHLVEITFNYWIGNDGIGSYEFWGSKGFDAGHDYVEEFEVKEWSLISLSGKTRRTYGIIPEYIAKAVESYVEKYEGELMEDNGPDEPDYDEE
jgi:hypothetical protein